MVEKTSEKFLGKTTKFLGLKRKKKMVFFFSRASPTRDILDNSEVKKIWGIFGAKKLWKPYKFWLISVHFEMWRKSKNKKMKKSEKNAKYCVQNPVRLGQSRLDNK